MKKIILITAFAAASFSVRHYLLIM